MAGVVRGLLGFPLRLVRAPVGFIVLLVGSQRRRTFGLPVAGLSEHRAQPVHFTLKRAASSREVGAGRGLFGEQGGGPVCDRLPLSSRHAALPMPRKTQFIPP